MSSHHKNLKEQIFLLMFTLQYLFHVASSDKNPFWCSKVQREATDVWSGQNISERFYMNDPFLDEQTLVWAKGESKWIKPYNGHLEYSGYGDSYHSRYRMTEVSNGTVFDLFIDYTEENDSGHHVVTVNIGTQILCTALMMNLTVTSPEPICSSRLSKSDGKLQMSCQWVQMNKGDRAQFEVEREFLYEQQIQEVNFEGTFNMTHYFSVNVGLDRLFDKITVPPRCVVSQRNGKVRDMCEFPVVRSEYILNETVDIECCTTKPSKPLPLLYDSYGKEFVINSSRNYIAGEDVCSFFFFCGAKGNHAEIPILKSLKIRGLAKHKGSTLLARFGGPTLYRSKEEQLCQNITVNFTILDSASNNQDGIPTESVTYPNCVSTQVSERATSSMPTEDTVKLPYITIAIVGALAASALAFIAGACIMKCYFMYKIPGEHQSHVGRETVGDPQRGRFTTEDDGAGARAMTTFTTQTHQQGGVGGALRLDCNQTSANGEMHSFKHETIEACFGPPTLPLRKETVADKCKGLPAGCVRSTSQNNAPTGGAGTRLPELAESTYFSVDDVEVGPWQTKDQESSSKNRSCSSASRQNTVRDDLKGTSSPTLDLDELYAKPDMSQKTKNKVSLESDYDDPMPTERDFFQSILVQEKYEPPLALATDQTYHVYGNAMASPTDELTSSGELYINTPSFPHLI